MVFMVILVIALSVAGLLAVLQFVFSSNFFSDSQLTTLEAGYEGLRVGVLMSSSFFSLVALFVLFDLELVFLFPGVFSLVILKSNSLWIFVLAVVILTLVLEWVWYGLKWQI